MDTSSEYAFPIFVSSTDYNLKDLRAELARFLTELGYRPIVSSAEGFPDSSPILEPWESCLPVLDKCFVMVLIIDGQYGTALNWPNFKEYFEGKKFSPTHAEYHFAHRARKRMLVFIRKSLMPHYQSYRTVIKKCNGDLEEARKILEPTLPDYVSFDTLDFINKVKTTKPIPWINEFDDITSVKKEIQKKMLNELAELFLIKNKHIDTVVDAFNRVMDSLSPEEQKKALGKINVTKEFTDAFDKLEVYKKDLEEKESALEKTKITNVKDRKKYEKEIDALNKKIEDLEKDSLKSSNSQFFIKDGQVKYGNPNYLGGGLSADAWNTAYFIRKCDQCGKAEHNPMDLSKPMHLVFANEFDTCPSCKRYLCNDCWPRYNLLTGTIIPDGILVPPEKAKTCSRCAS